MDGKLYNLGDNSKIVVKSDNGGVVDSSNAVQDGEMAQAGDGGMIGNTAKNNTGGSYGLSGQTGDYSLEDSSFGTDHSEKHAEEPKEAERVNEILGPQTRSRALGTLKVLDELN